MSELLPIFMFLIFFGVLRSFAAAAKKARKGAPDQSTVKKKNGPRMSAETGMDQKYEKEFSHLYQQVSMEDAMQEAHAHSDLGHGSLGPATPQGVDPCHDDPRAMPVGSLGISEMEGVDPCHDDPWAAPAGSLVFDSMEGKDPCHEEHWTADPAEEAPAASGGLNLRWTGDEMVKGFVYGEIFRRKVS